MHSLAECGSEFVKDAVKVAHARNPASDNELLHEQAHKVRAILEEARRIGIQDPEHHEVRKVMARELGFPVTAEELNDLVSAILAE